MVSWEFLKTTWSFKLMKKLGFEPEEFSAYFMKYGIPKFQTPFKDSFELIKMNKGVVEQIISGKKNKKTRKFKTYVFTR